MGFRNIKKQKQSNVNELEKQAQFPIPKTGSFKSIEIGSGDQTFKSDERGIWMGAKDFSNAPWRVDMQGNIEIRASDETQDTDISFYDADGNLVISIGFEDV